MIRRRRMPNACSKKTEPCANCWPPRSAPSCSPARPAPAPGLVADQRAGPRWYAGAACLAARTPRPSPAGAWAGPRSPRSIPWRSTARSCCWSCTGAHPPERTGASAASPVRLPLQPLQPLPGLGQEHADSAPEEPRHASEREPAPPASAATPSTPTVDAPARARMPTRRRLRPLPRSRPSRPGARARPHSPDHRNPRRTARQLAGRIESRAATLRRLELLRPAGLRLGRTQAILRTQPRMGHRQGMPCSPMNGPWTRRSAHPRPRLASSGTSEKISGKAQQNAPRNAETTRQ